IGALALIPSVAFAQEEDSDEGDVLIRIGQDVTVAEDESIGSVIVIDGDVQVDGTVRDLLLVIDGDATINGTIGENLTVISGAVTLAAGSTVDNVQAFDGDIIRQDGATVLGDVNERDSFEFLTLPAILFSLAVWAAI